MSPAGTHSTLPCPPPHADLGVRGSGGPRYSGPGPGNTQPTRPDVCPRGALSPARKVKAERRATRKYMKRQKKALPRRRAGLGSRARGCDPAWAWPGLPSATPGFPKGRCVQSHGPHRQGRMENLTSPPAGAPLSPIIPRPPPPPGSRGALGDCPPSGTCRPITFVP